MTRYKLPEVLGGGEIEATEWGSGCAGAGREYKIADTGLTLWVSPGSTLEMVEEPLPEEPPVGSVVLDVSGDAWQNTGIGGWQIGRASCRERVLWYV